MVAIVTNAFPLSAGARRHDLRLVTAVIESCAAEIIPQPKRPIWRRSPSRRPARRGQRAVRLWRETAERRATVDAFTDRDLDRGAAAAAVNGRRYALGYSESEFHRLEFQGGLFRDFTEDVLLRAGLAPGMQVLDAGCGVGDVSLLAADLVGPSGTVLGID